MACTHVDKATRRAQELPKHESEKRLRVHLELLFAKVHAKLGKSDTKFADLSTQHLAVDFVDGFEYKLNKAAQ